MYDSGIFSLKNADVFNSFPNENEMEEKLKQLKDLNVAKERDVYANMLMEKKRVEDKIVVCLKTLQNLNKNKSNIEELNHKNVNVFINFIETFALEDTYPKKSELWTPEEHKRNENKISNLKKDYFKTYYFETEDKKDKKSIHDFDLIRSARKKFLHDNASKIIHPEDFKCVIKDNISVNDFFEKLELYTENIKNKISKNFENNHKEIYCHSFLTFEKNIKTQNCEFMKTLREFLLEIYKPEDKIDPEKIIFDVTVNIIPMMDKEKVKISPLNVLRNNLVHNYQKSVLNNEKKIKEIKQSLHSLRSEVFKSYYSKEVHRSLNKFLLGYNIEILQCEFKKILESFQKEIVEEENISLVSGEHSKSFEYIFQESLFPEIDENINNLVDKYLKYAFIVEKKAGTKEIQIDDDYDAEDDDYDAEEDEYDEEIEYKKLNDEKKREIFEDFMKLKKSEELTAAQTQNERNKLKEKLKMYGLEVNYFDRVVGYYLDNSNELPEESAKKRDTIISIISSLKKIKKDFSLSNNAIINLYEKFLELKQKGITNLDKYCSSFDEILNKLNERQKSSILRILCDFPGVETIDIMIGDVKFAVLNTFDIIRNMLLTFCSSYDKYKIKFNNVEEAFNDDTFLDYLVGLNIEQNDKSKKLKDPYFVYIMIKKLIIVEYVSPFIAKLLIESNDVSVIDKEDFILLLGNLLKNKAYVKHLTKLLNVKSKNFNVYQEFCNQILDNNFKIENVHDILQEFNHVKVILNELDTMVQNIKSNHLMEDEVLKVEEFCDTFLKKDFNIKNTRSIFQDYSEVKVILNKLSAKIENLKVEELLKNNLKKVVEFWGKNTVDISFNDKNIFDELKEILHDLNAKIKSREINYCKEKNVKTIEQIIQQILKQLNIIAYELHSDNCYNDVIELLDACIAAGKKLKINFELENIIVDAEFQKAKSLIQISTEKNKCIDEVKMKEALSILHHINKEKERNPKFLLISAEIGYALRILKKYDQSDKCYERLYRKIAFNNSVDFKMENIQLSKLENSEEYIKMLAFSDDAKRYLDITNILRSCALNKICQGWEMIRKSKYQKALQNYKEALKTLEELNSFLRKSSKNTLDIEKRTIIRSKIALAKTCIGELLMKANKHESTSTLQCYQEALVKYIQYSDNLKKIYTDFHPIYKQSKYLLIKILNKIAYANERFGYHRIKWVKRTKCNEIKQWQDILFMYEEAQNISKKLFLVSSCSESDKKRISKFLRKVEDKINDIKKSLISITH